MEEAIHFQAENSASSSMVDVGNETDGNEEDLRTLPDWDSRISDTDRDEPSLGGGASILKSVVAGLGFAKEDLENYLSTSHPEHESESVDDILSRLIQAIEEERQQHLAESDSNCKQELADTKVKLKEMEDAKNRIEAAYNRISLQKRAQTEIERERLVRLKDELSGILRGSEADLRAGG